MNDVRDEAIGALLDREASRIESAPVDRLPEVIQRGSRRRAIRFTAIAAAVAVFVGALSWAGLRNEGRGTIPGNIADWDTFASLQDNGWTIQVPPPWRIQSLPACSNAPRRIGVMVTNAAFEFLGPQGGSPRCDERLVFAGFPRDGVAFRFQPWGDFGIEFGRKEPDTLFPLSPGSLEREATGDIRGGPSESDLLLWVGGDTFGIVRRYVGPEASSEDVATLDRMIGSLRVRGATRWIEAEAGLTTLHDETSGYAVTYPDGWGVADQNLTPWLSSPSEILSLGTFPLRVSDDPEDGFRLFDAPVAPAALEDITGRDAFISVQGGTESFGDARSRPDHFGPLDCEDAIYGCQPAKDLPEPWRSAPFRAWWIPFQDSGRAFYLFVAIGNEATPELRDEAWAVADSLAFDPDAG